jgi:glycosyltransferase involved in cell wall biosynthesis
MTDLHKPMPAQPGQRPTVMHALYSGLGGHGAVLFGLIAAGFLSEHHHRILFVGVEPPRTEYIQKCEALQLPWHYVPRIEGGSRIQFIWDVCQALRRVGPDKLFLHGLATVPGVLLWRMMPRLKRSFVLLRETQANDLKGRGEWVSLAMAHWGLDKIVHLTPEAASGAKAALGRWHRDSKVSVISNGIDTDFFCPQHAPQARPRPSLVIGMQSRLQPNKDHGTLLEAFALVCKAFPQLHLELRIAGDGITFDGIRQRADRLGLTPQLTMTGMLDNTQLGAFLQSLDIYVHCTHGETMSTAIMQALACGLPTIASDVAGVSNMVGPDIGLLYAPGQAQDLCRQITHLIAHQDVRQKLSQNARAFATTHYSAQAMAARYERLFSGA